jgi:hypothetical protein
MPNIPERIRQARHNFKFLESLENGGLSGEFSDWVVTVCFYTAVHYIEAGIGLSETLFIEPSRGRRDRVSNSSSSDPHCSETLVSQAGIYNTSQHNARKLVLRWNTRAFPGCVEAYGTLLDQSKSARYNAQIVPPSEVAVAMDAARKIHRVIEGIIALDEAKKRDTKTA